MCVAHVAGGLAGWAAPISTETRSTPGNQCALMVTGKLMRAPFACTRNQMAGGAIVGGLDPLARRCEQIVHI